MKEANERIDTAGKSKTSIGHFHYCFFERSETFIHHQLVSMEQYRPVAISLLARNHDEFRLPNGVVYDVGFNLNKPGLQFIYPFRYYALKLAGELFRREGISLLHAHFGTWAAYALPLQKSLRVPMVVTFYGQDVSLLPRKTLWRKRFARLWNHVDLFLVEGPFMMKELIRIGAPKEKVALQRIGIPVSSIAFQKPTAKKGTPPTALWAARMIEKKGLLDALKAIKILRDQGLILNLRVVGDGMELKKGKAFVNENSLDDTVTFLDFLTYRQYLKEFTRADIFLAPSKTSSRGETEGGAPTTILEAQARGLPVVATRHADIPFVLPKNYPYLAEENNPEDLAKVLGKMLTDRSSWQAIAWEGRKHVEKFHNLPVTVQSLENHYSLILKDH